MLVGLISLISCVQNEPTQQENARELENVTSSALPQDTTFNILLLEEEKVRLERCDTNISNVLREFAAYDIARSPSKVVALNFEFDGKHVATIENPFTADEVFTNHYCD